LGAWAVKEINKPQPAVAILPPETVISTLRTAEVPVNLSGQKVIESQEAAIASPVLSNIMESSEISMPSAIASLMLSSVKPFRLPSNSYREIIKQLPRNVLSMKYLKDWAKSVGIKGYSKMSKAKLVQALSPA